MLQRAAAFEPAKLFWHFSFWLLNHQIFAAKFLTRLKSLLY